ncbi:MAG: tetratricopeptide repeat protein [Desulfobacterales bacterium]|nr:tetratricopeptide repeat protein [Desulfobacterales bacterium]
MAEKRIFVGRKAELEQFGKVLEDPKGQAVLVVGQAGMGKTWLINKMAEVTENHPELKCGWVRYEVTPTNSVDSTMELMMDNAFEAARTEPGSFDDVPQRKKQWLALLNVINIGDLVMSLRREPAKNTREQFLERLSLISKRMPKNGRAVFIIDPEKYMQEKSDQSWAIVVKELPEKIKFVFAQRPEDVLVGSETFEVLDNVVRIPGERIGVLEEEAVDELLTLRGKGLKCTVTEVRKVLSRYKGHPYALGAALDLIEGGIKLEELPEKPEPTKFAAVQWKEVSNRSEDAIRLFKGYAILEVGVPDGVVEAVGELESDTRQHLLADKYLRGLLREEGEGRRIYHAILADYIVGQIGEDERKEYHGRAVKVYREKLAEAKKAKTKPDALAAMRLAEHVLAAEGKEAFVYAFANECIQPLFNLGLLDAAIALSERALNFAEKESEEEAMVRGNLGIIYQTRGESDKAEEMFREGLKIDEKLGQLKGIATKYGNLGIIYRTRGELDKAEEMHVKSLEIAEKLELQEVMASDYGNLGIVYMDRGDLDKAEEMHRKALDIDKDIGRLEGQAIRYGNLGLIYRRRGELDKAEEILREGLKIDEKLELQEVMASDYGNLGNVYYMRGELDKAEEMYVKSLQISEAQGMVQLTANQYGNLGIVYQKQGELDKAEEMHKKSLEIKERVGLQEGMANSYGNLGLVYKTRGDLDKAEEMHKKSLEIEKKLGHLEGMANSYGNLGLIYEERGDVEKAREYWEKAVGLFKKIGMPHKVEKVEGWLEKLED